ncbi:Ti-type conjugative transfer relaxase TraA [Agrobacterium vitis]|uniref:Ti-type conjugative transfer relaxase TraA n=1 Tax=Agrobacterium vitis TaxID=373 RepID=UPI001573056E|nr:Ti-type conjugative transfer relaxase TraA [Agrobacterium vitis]NSZ15595.1 Ti-type conjugative transfer relaxase TraA [Agrobacterium vitis]UJL91589.1 Ti-type conjugative transfer relaxase TraA [Agrobacterium vitis]
MAIYHASMKPVSRSSGRSAVASAAYRAGERLINERDGLTHDFSRKQGVEHVEIVLPEGVNAEWAKDRQALWNAAEFAENRKDARVAREIEIGLPHELTAEQRLDLTRAFAQDLANRYGGAVDFAIHAPHSASDVRNHHAHLLMTTRQVTEEGLGEKTHIEWKNVRLLNEGLPTTQMQLRDIRQSWEQHANEHLAMAGLDIRVDHRSHSERGLELEPTEHMGVHATQMQRRGLDVSRTRLDAEAAQRNAELIREKPEQVLSIVTNEKSVFDRHDIARTLHRYINDDPQTFQNAFATVMASPALVELQGERMSPETGEIELARYSTREMVGIESGMATSATRLHEAQTHGVDRRHVDRAVERQDAAIQQSAGDASARLSDEQRGAIEHITGPERIAAVVGYAGAGKSTMLAAAREAWEAQGYTVHGAALSGKAAEGLEESSGIQSRTLASYEYRWQTDRGTLGRGDVFVIDEAGMIGSRQLSRFVNEAEARGAKIVLVGDHEQLQAIGAGAPFRAIAEQIGHAELSEIRRQRVDWQREASVSFATHRTAEGLAAYRERGDIRLSETKDEARGEIVRDYLADRDERPDGTRVAMAHRRADVRAINDEIRSALQERGELARTEVPGEAAEQREGLGRALTFQTNDGKREFAPGDRIVFLENDRDLGVKNGMLGTVESVEPGRIVAQLDGKGDTVSVPMNDYRAVDHGYATTIHKNQGATVDRAFVMASGTMDRHLTYVAMTRHRDGAQLYAAQEEFADRRAGKLVEHGLAPYEHKAGNRDSYFVTLENDRGEKHTVWGVDLERAMKEAAPEIGDRIGLEHRGSETVRLPDGTTAERNSWKVHEGGELAYAQLENRLSRSGVKETTLDYVSDFAERRGIAEQMGVRSEIELRPDREPTQEQTRAERQSQRPRIEAEKVGEDPRQVSALPKDLASDRIQEHGDDRQQRPRRGMFDGLKLGRSAATERPQQDRAAPAQERPERTETPRRGMFDGLKLNVDRGAASAGQTQPERGERMGEALVPDRQVDRLRRPSDMERAIDRYARAYDAAERNHREGLPILETQKLEMRQAGQQLDQARPGASALMVSALQHDPEARAAMQELSGRERVGQLSAGMDRERAALADPNVRAERFVQRWQELQGERQELRGWQNDEARGKVEGQMRGMTKSLERDPQVESILRNRSQDLGIGHVRQSESLARNMEQSLARGRSQNLGMER